jgi:hypothetical protein
MVTGRDTIRRITPDTLLSARHRRRGQPFHPEPIALRRLKRIEHASRDVLLDPVALEALIGELGLNDHYSDYMPMALHPQLGKGLRISQYPNQFAPYLASLVDREIPSYVEIGVQHGGTFATTVTYLRTTGHPLARALAVDTLQSYGAERFARQSRGVDFFRGDSHSREFATLAETIVPGALVMIDGDHSYEACRADVALADNLGAAVVVLHDIVSARDQDVVAVWQQIRESLDDRYEFCEFTAQYRDVQTRHPGVYLGIGVAIRR